MLNYVSAEGVGLAEIESRAVHGQDVPGREQVFEFQGRAERDLERVRINQRGADGEIGMEARRDRRRSRAGVLDDEGDRQALFGEADK